MDLETGNMVPYYIAAGSEWGRAPCLVDKRYCCLMDSKNSRLRKCDLQNLQTVEARKSFPWDPEELVSRESPAVKRGGKVMSASLRKLNKSHLIHLATNLPRSLGVGCEC